MNSVLVTDNVIEEDHADICSSLYSSVHVYKSQRLWSNKLDNWDSPPISAQECRVWLVLRRRVIDELLNRKLCEGRLSLGSRRRRKTAEALAEALTMRSI